ncbi:WEB family protein At3g51220-like [Impatiens glandulifera]|uniref:WEB family protein At3g51220-like n=1 Tax=Impatiens glandulifera TaxID=253017 RepID=UPI001FB0859A|nr:WEB family protein At3g51220-like [Impatiens glandulifera]
MEEEEEGGLRKNIAGIISRAEIDTTPPFRSVKEAVTLFGDKVLAGKIYLNKPKEMIEIEESDEEEGEGSSRCGSLTTELYKAKQSLLKAKEESLLMKTCIYSLQEELEKTKFELKQLKEHEESDDAQSITFENDIEDLKCIEESSESITQTVSIHEVQKKRYVTFANCPSLAKVIVPNSDNDVRDSVLERLGSLKKKNKKPLIPLIGGFFSKMKLSSKKLATSRA